VVVLLSATDYRLSFFPNNSSQRRHSSCLLFCPDSFLFFLTFFPGLVGCFPSQISDFANVGLPPPFSAVSSLFFPLCPSMSCCVNLSPFFAQTKYPNVAFFLFRFPLVRACKSMPCRLCSLLQYYVFATFFLGAFPLTVHYRYPSGFRDSPLSPRFALPLLFLILLSCTRTDPHHVLSSYDRVDPVRVLIPPPAPLCAPAVSSPLS